LAHGDDFALRALLGYSLAHIFLDDDIVVDGYFHSLKEGSAF